MQNLVNVRLPSDTDAPGKARRALRDLPAEFHPALETLELLVTELVSNCVRHARLTPSEEIELSVRVNRAGLLVEVRDPGRRYDEAVAGWNRAPESADRWLEQEGFGLFLVSKASDRSGVRWDDGTVVWFELDGYRTGPVEGRATDP